MDAWLAAVLINLTWAGAIVLVVGVILYYNLMPTVEFKMGGEQKIYFKVSARGG